MEEEIYSQRLRKAIQVPAFKFKKIANEKRLTSIAEAISWKGGSSLKRQRHHEIWNSYPYSIVLAKPGKEINEFDLRAKDGSRVNNPNDMRPLVLKKSKSLNISGSFEEIFSALQAILRDDKKALELIACLLFRNAFMLDHIEIKRNKWRYNPPEIILNRIKRKIPNIYNIPSSAFLHYLNALALNEDVKYYTLGYDITTGIGRQNNLLTCVNLIAVFLDRVSIIKFAGSLTRPPVGIAAITQKKALELFPLLRPDNT